MMTSSADNEQKICPICCHVYAGIHLSTGKRRCPACFARWEDLPPVTLPNTYALPLQKQKRPRYDHTPQSSLKRSKREPRCFNDDEPLPLAAVDDHKSKDSFGEWQKVTIKAIPERRAVAASESVSQFTVVVGLKAPSLKDNARHAPLDMITVLDVSGSMRGTKLELVREAMHFVIDNLGDSDRLSIVVFSDFARRILPLCRMTASGREDAKRAVYSLGAHGGTNINAGLKKGARVLDQRRHKNPVTSILLLSDGQDSDGQDCPPLLKDHQGTIPVHPVHTIGFGSDHDPVRMHAIAYASGGTPLPKDHQGTIPVHPVHSFGFGSDHDPVRMHAIADASGGTPLLKDHQGKIPVHPVHMFGFGSDHDPVRMHAIADASGGTPLPKDHQGTIPMHPVHTFGFGSDHDPVRLHAIAEASGGTFSFVENYEMIQDAFAGCIGGLLSVVAQEVRLKLTSASRGVEIKSIPSGRCRSQVMKEIKSIPSGGYTSEITNQGSEGLINVGELYADEEKAFLINISIPMYTNRGGERKTSLLDITCSYEDTISKRFVVIEGDTVEIGRPMVPSSQELAVNVEVDRQRNRLRAAESIKQAQQMAEAGNLSGAEKWLAEKTSDLMATAAAKAGDGMTKWLVGEMKETAKRMASARMYQQSGRAYALSGMSSHAAQRATTRGQMVAGGALVGGSSLALGGSGGEFGGYATPQMGTMVIKSRQR